MQLATIRYGRLISRLIAILAIAIMLFAIVYSLLANNPESGLRSQDGALNFFDYVYFSVVTITTLGYGDITPLGWSRLVASIEVLFGLGFVGFSISQIVSARQEAIVEYLAKDRIAQTYDECLERVRDAKELIGDRRRSMQSSALVDPIDFIFNRSNPFYPALRAMEILNGYTAHVESIGQAAALSTRVERAAHHVEELAGFTRKYINVLVAGRLEWRTDRTKQILLALCQSINTFSNSYVIHTRYASQPYKGGGLYKDIVQDLTRSIEERLG